MASSANRVIKNTGYLYIKLGITMFISLYTTRLILNSLGASDFGVFNIVGGAISMLGFLNGTMADATQRFMAYTDGKGNKEELKSVFNVSLILHLGVAIVTGVLFVVVGMFLFDGILNIPQERIFAAKIVYGSLIVSTMLTMLSVPYDALITSHEDMLYYAVVGLLESFLKLTVAFIVVYTSSDKLIVYGILMACIPMLTMLIMRIYCHRKYMECVIQPRRYYSQDKLKSMLTFFGCNVSARACGLVTFWGAGIILNYFFGTILNAAQGIAIQLSGQLSVLSNNMLRSINPVVNHLAGEGNLKKMNKVSLLGCKYSFFLLSFIAIPFLLEMKYILRLWLKIIPDFAVIFCQLQIVRIMLDQTLVCLNTAINAQGNIKTYSAFKTVLNILPLVLVPLCFWMGLQPYWLHIIWILCWSFMGMLVTVYFAYRNCNMSIKDYFTEVLLRCLSTTLFAVISGLIVKGLMAESFLRLVTCFIVSILVFVVAVWLIGTNKDEHDKFKKIIKNVASRIRK